MHNKLGNKLDELNAFVEAANAYKQCSPKGVQRLETRHTAACATTMFGFGCRDVPTVAANTLAPRRTLCPVVQNHTATGIALTLRICLADAVAAFSAAAEMCMDQNRLGPAAKHYKEIGEIYEGEFEFDKGIKALKQAADFFKMDNQNSNSNTCNLKVAAHSAQHINDYDAAIKIFETVGKEASQNNLLKYSAKKYFFQAGLCRLAADKPLEDSKAHIESYKDYDVTFVKQRECGFLLGACEAIEAGDAEDFTAKITAYDNISQLDPWTTSICLRIKKAIGEVDLNDLTGNDAGGAAGGEAGPVAGGGDDGDELC